MVFIRFLILMVGCVLSWNSAAIAAVTAHVDRFNISENETINLTIEVTGSDSGDPQTAPLQKNFEILSNSHSSSFSIINGSTSSKSIWQLALRPRHTGNLTIPALKVGSAASNPIMIQVSKVQSRTSPAGHPSGDVWVSMEVSPQQLRVQQQAIITIRVYQAVSLNQAQLSEPKAEHAIIERLGADNTYQKRDNNRTWQVTERHYALFPQQRGHIDIAPLQFDGTELVGGTSYYQPFQTTRPIRVRSNALKLNVSGMPVGWKAADWLPAKQVRIEESWPQPNAIFTVGEPITRTLTLHANGLSASQLPEFSHDLPDHLKAYADKPVLKDEKTENGVHGMHQEKVVIMPMQAGTYILPEIDIDWWNTVTKKMEQATLSARTFTVAAAAVSLAAPTAAPTSAPASAPPAPLQKTPLTTPQVQPKVPVMQAHTGLVASWWQWLALFFAAAWLLTLASVWYLRRSREVQKQEGAGKNASNIKQAAKAIETACHRNDAKDCEQALLRLACLQHADSSIHSLSALTQICSEALQAEVLNLEQVLYASGASAWQGDALLRVFRQESGFTTVSSDLVDKASALPGLYPEYDR